MDSLEKERLVASQAAIVAARLCLAVRDTLVEAGAMEKAGREPVTVADYGSQAVILKMIAESFPEDRVVAEERAAEFRGAAAESQQEAVLRYLREAAGIDATLDDVSRWLDFGRGQGSARLWAVDPIDGTKGFLRGEQFAIAIALLIDGTVALSALACPMMPYDPRASGLAQGVLAIALRDSGATLQTLDGNASHALRVSPQQEASQARVVESVESGHSDHNFSTTVLTRAGIAGQPTRMDSQAKYLAVADGRAEIYLRHSVGARYTEKIWDHAAGVLVIEEAGGRVTDLDGKALDFSRGERLSDNHGVLATNGPLHDSLLAAIRTAR